MKTKNPEIAAYMNPAYGEVVPQQEYAGWEHEALIYPDTQYGDQCKSKTLEYSEPLIRLSDYEALQAESEMLRKAIRRLCNIYVVDDYYSGDIREEHLNRAVERAMQGGQP